METIIHALTSNKVLLAVAVLISIIIVLSVFTKLVKVAVVLLAILILYVGYLVYTGQKVPETRREVIEYSERKFDSLKKNGIRTLKRNVRK
jgi:ABC-type bacteriocin/lantibiotic exporter with double-glycine peptidase domain